MAIPLYVMRVRKWGTSLAVILDRGLRRDLNIGLGDILAVRVQKPYAVFCVWPASTAVRLNEVDASLLPPRSPREVTRA